MNIEPSQKARKTQLRKALRTRRTGVDAVLRQQWDGQINQALLEYAAREQPATIAAFLAFDGEPDLVPALTSLNREGITLALPVVREQPGNSVITFHAWTSATRLEPNRYGIAEPYGTRLVPVPEIDLVLVPLVGWDADGGRLGMGASFYDRLFQPFAELPKPVRLGVAYDLQKVDSVPHEPWDVQLHGMLTENGRFTFGS